MTRVRDDGPQRRVLHGLPDHSPDERAEPLAASSTRLPRDLLVYARRLSVAVAAEMLRRRQRSVAPGVGQTLRLLAHLHGHMNAPLNALDQARLDALRAVLEREHATSSMETSA